MSNQKFKDVSDCLASLPTDEAVIAKQLRQIIIDCLPNCIEKLSYNVPYYYVNRPICFIWPGSVIWGNTRSYDGVRLGFTKGHLMSNHLDYFDRGDRKFVIYRDYTSVSDIDEDILKLHLFEAYDIDQQFSPTQLKRR